MHLFFCVAACGMIGLYNNVVADGSAGLVLSEEDIYQAVFECMVVWQGYITYG
jgi:hypothetical protein